jgi:hypothetical protein
VFIIFLFVPFKRLKIRSGGPPQEAKNQFRRKGKADAVNAMALIPQKLSKRHQRWTTLGANWEKVEREAQAKA